jgi:primosomal protein DnaI
LKPIQETLKNLTNKDDFKKRYDALKKEVTADPDVRRFIQKHEISETVIEKGLMKLFEYVIQSKNCQSCQSLDECKNMLKGYEPHLIFNGRTIDIHYDRCPRKIAFDERKKQEDLIQSLYIPKEILSANMADIEPDTPSRVEVIKKAHEFVNNYEPGKRMKGLYLYGPFGVGKTYILGAIANQLAEKRITSMLIYVPEFMRELKSAIQDHTLNDKIEAVKKAPILMLDDIGAESMSSWMRDDILGPILQFRMLENLPTFFTSNFDFHQLEHHLSYTQRGEEEKVKAARIMERIKYLAEPIEIRGKNRRLER